MPGSLSHLFPETCEGSTVRESLVWRRRPTQRRLQSASHRRWCVCESQQWHKANTTQRAGWRNLHRMWKKTRYWHEFYERALWDRQSRHRMKMRSCYHSSLMFERFEFWSWRLCFGPVRMCQWCWGRLRNTLLLGKTARETGGGDDCARHWWWGRLRVRLLVGLTAHDTGGGYDCSSRFHLPVYYLYSSAVSGPFQLPQCSCLYAIALCKTSHTSLSKCYASPTSVLMYISLHSVHGNAGTDNILQWPALWIWRLLYCWIKHPVIWQIDDGVLKEIFVSICRTLLSRRCYENEETKWKSNSGNACNR